MALHSHEIAHHVDKKYGATKNIPANLHDALRSLDYQPGRKDKNVGLKEGFAELVRMYLLNEQMTAAQAPLFQWLDTFMAANEKVQRLFRKHRALIERWRLQGARSRVAAETGNVPRTPIATSNTERLFYLRHTNRDAWNYMYTHWVDAFHPATLFEKAAREKGWTSPEGTGPVAVMRAMSRTAGSRANEAVEGEGIYLVSEGEPQKIGESLKSAVSEIHLNEWDDFQAYARAVHVLAIHSRAPKINPQMSVEDATAIVQEVQANPERAARYNDARKRLVKWFNNLQFMMQDAGAITADLVEANEKLWGDTYLPMYRHGIHGIVAPLRGKIESLRTPIRKMAGSGEPISDLFDAAVITAIARYDAAVKAQIHLALRRLYDPKLGAPEGMGEFGIRVLPLTIKNDESIEPMLKQLVDVGVVEQGLVKAMRIRARIREAIPPNARRAPDQLALKDVIYLADFVGVPHGLTQAQLNRKPRRSDITVALLQAIEDEAQYSVPDIKATIALWKRDYSPSSKERITADYTGEKPVLVQWPPLMYEMLVSLDPYVVPKALKLFASVNKLVKLGWTSLNTAFTGRNPVKDYDAFVNQTKWTNARERTYGPLAWMVRYFLHTISTDKQSISPRYWLHKKFAEKYEGVHVMYRREGGFGATRLRYDESSVRAKKLQVLPSSAVEKVRYAAVHPLGMIREYMSLGAEAYIDILSAPELGPRYAEMIGYLRNHGYTWNTDTRDWTFDGLNAMGQQVNTKVASPPRYIIFGAINAAADVTVNFGKMGITGRKVDKEVTFFNASLQGNDKFFRTVLDTYRNAKEDVKDKRYKDAVMQPAILASSIMTVATVLWWMYRHDDDDYKDSPAWFTRGGFSFPLAEDLTLFLPHSREWGGLPILITSILEAISKDDAGELLKGLEVDVNNRMPSFNVPLVTPAFQIAMNRDGLGRPIESKREKGRLTEYGYDEYTLPLSVLIGKATSKFGLSPSQLEFFLSSSTGGMYERFQRFPIAAYEAVFKDELDYRRIPFLGGLVYTHDYHDSVNAFYDRLEHATSARNTINQLNLDELDGLSRDQVLDEATKFESFADVMSRLRQQAEDQPDTPEGKKTAKALSRYIVGIAREALGKPELDKYPFPFSKGRGVIDAGDETVNKEFLRRVGHLSGNRPVTRDKADTFDRVAKAERKWFEKHGFTVTDVAKMYQDKMVEDAKGTKTGRTRAAYDSRRARVKRLKANWEHAR